jgi:sugar phosphate isomerase/epimerase
MSTRLFDRSNLFAWCVASHDAGKRDAMQRAAMLRRLGFSGQAWGNRMAMASELPRFHAEVQAMKEHGLNLVARYVPTKYDINQIGPILDAIAQHQLKPQLWVSGMAMPDDCDTQAKRVAFQLIELAPLAGKAREYGLTVGLYNHIGWFGDPRNQLDIILALRQQGLDNVGIAHSQHWGHAWLDEFEPVLERIKPYLSAVTLSGMTRDGDKTGQQFLPVGAGQEDVRVLGALARSGWTGPVGLINHTDCDAEARLQDHLAGLDWIRAQIAGQRSDPPSFRTWPMPAATRA